MKVAKSNQFSDGRGVGAIIKITLEVLILILDFLLVKYRIFRNQKLHGRRLDMDVAMILCQDNPEIMWNGFRLANMMLEGMEEVTIFLNGPSVQYEGLSSEKFPLKELAKVFTLSEGTLLA